jgi:hypothetical protein
VPYFGWDFTDTGSAGDASVVDAPIVDGSPALLLRRDVGSFEVRGMTALGGWPSPCR